jgi:nickel-type superoxide dismutase maturation protease
MTPTLVPGDRVLAARTRVRTGDVVAVRDPREQGRVIVKRVTSVHDAGVEVLGDNPDASTDSRHFGVVPRALVIGRVVYRYAPADRAGRIKPDVSTQPGDDLGERRVGE